MKSTNVVRGTSISILLLFALIPNVSFAQESNAKTEVVPLDSAIGIEKTTVTFSVPKNNKLPWAFVEGKISNYVPDYPVIIQIYDNDDLNVNGNNVGAVHFAQAEVGEDGSYEYKFRVMDVRNGKTINIFDGDYTVKIFKVVYLHQDLNVA